MGRKVVKNKQWRVEKEIPAAFCNSLLYPDEYRTLCLPHQSAPAKVLEKLKIWYY